MLPYSSNQPLNSNTYLQWLQPAEAFRMDLLMAISLLMDQEVGVVDGDIEVDWEGEVHTQTRMRNRLLLLLVSQARLLLSLTLPPWPLRPRPRSRRLALWSSHESQLMCRDDMKCL